MIYLSKILPTLVLPTGIILILLCAGLVFRRKSLCWLGIATLWVFSTPLTSDFLLRAAEAWEVRRPVSAVPTADAIVVLSTGRVTPPGSDRTVSEWTDADRFYGGVELFKAQKAPFLVFTGGWQPWHPDAAPEGEVLIQRALDLAIPLDRMLTTPKVSNTEEEARTVSAMLAERRRGSTQRVLLVTSAYHMRRAALVFGRAGLEVVPFPVDFKVSSSGKVTILDFVPGASSLSRSETALREFYGLAFYALLKR